MSAMSMSEGFPRTIKRPRPNTDVVVAGIAASSGDGTEQLIRVDGLECIDYLTPPEASALANALTAAGNDLAHAKTSRVTPPPQAREISDGSPAVTGRRASGPGAGSSGPCTGR
jgi:hypothetical protein